MDGYPHPPDRGDTDVIARRIGAQILDTIVVTVLLALFFTLSAPDSLTFLAFVGFFVALVYWFALEGLWDGQTVGKKATGIKVVKEDGGECTVGAAVLRNVFDLIDGLFYYLIGFLVMAFSDKRQRIGDRLAGTMVVRANPAESETETTTTEPTPDASAWD